jgi:predicted ester cyclase
MHGVIKGRSALKAMMAEFREAFPDLNFWGVGEPIAEGDYVAACWEGGGTHTGPAFGALPLGSLPAASGKTMRFTGMTIFRIVDGKVVEEIGEEGALTALQQLGLVPKAHRRNSFRKRTRRTGSLPKFGRPFHSLRTKRRGIESHGSVIRVELLRVKDKGFIS